MEGGLQDGAGLLEVVGLPSYLLFSTSQDVEVFLHTRSITPFLKQGWVSQGKRNIGLDVSLTLGTLNFKVDPSFFGQRCLFSVPIQDGGFARFKTVVYDVPQAFSNTCEPPFNHNHSVYQTYLGDLKCMIVVHNVSFGMFSLNFGYVLFQVKILNVTSLLVMCCMYFDTMINLDR